LERVIFFNRNDLRRKNGTVIHTFIGDEMNHHTRMFDLAALVRIESALDSVGSGEYAGQCWMEIYHAIGKMGKKQRRKKPHPTGENNVVREARRDVHSKSRIVFFA
jgi:hypothetical protein